MLVDFVLVAMVSLLVVDCPCLFYDLTEFDVCDVQVLTIFTIQALNVHAARHEQNPPT